MIDDAHGSAGPALDSLLGDGFEQAEVFEKASRSRAAVWEPDRLTCSGVEERGWAVRASGAEGSIHQTGTGATPARGPWIRPVAPSFDLPGPDAVAGSAAGGSREGEEPDDLDAPLLGEGEVVALLRALSERLGAELSKARLLEARLEDGIAEVAIANSHGIRAAHRVRLATLDLWAALGGRETRIAVAAREPRRFGVGSLARRLADQLVVLGEGTKLDQPVEAPCVLTGEIVAGVLEGLQPLWLGSAGRSRLEQICDAEGRFGSAVVTVVDDGRMPGGLLAAPVDGEGVATRRVVLVEAGVPRGTLRSWREGAVKGEEVEPVGCVRRPGWRDLPRPGPSHLFLEPDARAPASALLEELGSGFYFLGFEGPPRIDWEAGAISLGLYGFRIGPRGSSGPVRGARVRTSICGLFSRIARVARDLRFSGTAGGCVGSPSVRVEPITVEPG